jgi:hypothetical protein
MDTELVNRAFVEWQNKTIEEKAAYKAVLEKAITPTIPTENIEKKENQQALLALITGAV